MSKKGFDKLVDGEASSPARCRGSNLRFEPSAVSPRAKPENPKGFQPSCHPHQFLLKSKRFPGAKTARKRFLLWKMRFTKTAPCPPYTPLGAIESSRGLRPSRALRGFFDSLKGTSVNQMCPYFFAPHKLARLLCRHRLSLRCLTTTSFTKQNPVMKNTYPPCPQNRR